MIILPVLGIKIDLTVPQSQIGMEKANIFKGNSDDYSLEDLDNYHR